MAAHPVPGKLYIGPTNATTGGTQVTGVEGDQFSFDDGRGVRHFGGGLEADNWVTLAGAPERPAALEIPVRDVSSTTLQLLFSMLSTGTGLDSHGGNGTAPHGTPPSVALVIRPKDTTQDYFYGPAWRLHADSVKRLVWSRNVWHYEGSLLVLAPHRSSAGKKAYMKGTASAINTYYGL